MLRLFVALQVLDQVSPKPTEVFCDWARKYPNKNRTNNFLPRELCSGINVYSIAVGSCDIITS